MKNRFKDFTDEELYVLKRAFLESTEEFMFNDKKYTKRDLNIHDSLSNEVIDAIKERSNDK